MSDGAARPGAALRGAAGLAIAGLAIAVFWWVHARAGLSFPVPLPDEASFLWQSLAVAERGSLFAPELNPERPILWMPPGYAILTGAVFRATGFSLPWARSLSALCATIAFLALVLGLRSLRAPLAGLLLLCGVFLARDFVFAGNQARMEALLVALLALAGWLLLLGRWAPALALLGLAPLVHPNALPVAVAAVALAVWGRGRPGEWRPGRVGGALLALCAAAWVAYAIYAGRHAADFWHDMAFQLRWKGQPGPLELAYWRAWAAPWRLALGALMALAVLLGRAFASPAPRLLAIAAPLWLLPLAPGEWYYGVLRAFVFALTGLCTLDGVARAAAARELAPGARRALVALALLGLTALGLSARWIESPRDYPHAMQVAGMRIAPEPAYIDASDRLAVRAYLLELAARRPADDPPLVVFEPRVDALFFEDLRREGLRFANPILTSVQPDVAIVHLSRLMPEGGLFPSRQRLLDGSRSWLRLRARDGSEEWRANPRPGPASHGVRELRSLERR